MRNTYKISFWEKRNELVSYYSTKALGNLSFRTGDRSAIKLNRIKMSKELGIDWNNVFLMPLSHSNNVLSLPAGSSWTKDTTSGVYLDGGHIFRDMASTIHDNPEWQVGLDAVVTDIWNLFPIILSADCATVGFYDPRKEVIAIAHVGLIGAINGIVTRTILCMSKEYGSQSQDIEVVIFPSIRKCHYDLERSGAWQRLKGDAVTFYGENNPIFANNMFDLQGLIVKQAVEAGVRNSNIFDTQLCTVCNREVFFSNLAAGSIEGKKREGRFASILGMRK